MHIHILGVCGTFMGGVALLAKQMGYRVTGSDENVYPPMSTQLESAGIELIEGYEAAQLDITPDKIIIGNVMTRGHAVVERMLEEQRPMMSGPQWLSENLLRTRWVLAVSGTHGKTTTASMLAWILEFAGLNPGFLIGGVPQNFNLSARIGDKPFFVIEADEYDTAFFDKRSKFIHYQPRTLIMNNLEFDHADIFDNIADIKKQFHHLIKIVPQQGKIIFNKEDSNVLDVLEMGCWSEQESFGLHSDSDWVVKKLQTTKAQFKFSVRDGKSIDCAVNLLGEHNAMNALAAIAAARHAGIAVETSVKALAKFEGVKRRLENKGSYNDISIFDDFAHHPTEIRCTLNSFRQKFESQRLIVVFEPRSNTMQMGIHKGDLKEALAAATELFVYNNGNLNWSVEQALEGISCTILGDIDQLVDSLLETLRPKDNVVLLSNGGFGGLCEKLINALQQRSSH